MICILLRINYKKLKRIAPMTALEGRNSTDAQHEVIEREEFLCLLLIAGKAMEHARPAGLSDTV